MKALTASLLCTILLLSLLGAPYGAQESNESKELSGEDGTDFESLPREVEVDQQVGEFEIRSFGSQGDRLRVRFKADSGELRLDFTSENNTVEVQLQLTMEALMEFIPADGGGPPPDLSVQTVQRFEIEDMFFEALVFEEIADGYRIGVEYRLLEMGPSLGFNFWVFQNETLLPVSSERPTAVLVRPTEVKFDVLISSFPFESLDSNLALEVELKTEVEPKLNFTGAQAELEAIGERYAGYFRWSKNATVDGETVPVISTVSSTETEFEILPEVELEVERTVILSYPRGDRIVHDPMIGVSAAPILPPPPPPDNGGLDGIVDVIAPFSNTAYLVVLGAAVLFVVATLLARRRRA